jgi:hypothetical protein
MPTVLDAMGVPAPEEMQGESVLLLLDGKPRRRDFVFGLSQNMEACFLVRDGYKFISAPGLDPMEIGLRHLGPRSPPAPGLDAGQEYVRGGQTRGPYDMGGDPLGLRDVLAGSPRLFRRADDPGERDDLYTDERDRAERMAGQSLALYESSMALAERLDDGSTVMSMSPQQQQTLQQLGYLAAEPGADQRQLLDALPKQLQQPLKHPRVAPDTTLLDEADRDVHRVRLALAEGHRGDLGVGQLLTRSAERYARWYEQHPGPEMLPRVAWRIEAVATLASEAGIAVDVERWRRMLADLGRGR